MIWTYALSVACYLVILLGLISEIKKNHPEFWESIGSPSSTDARGQMKILKIILLPNSMPKEISEKYRVRMMLVRCTFAVVLLCFSIIILVSIAT